MRRVTEDKGARKTAELAGSYSSARDVMRLHAHTFYFAARWLRPERREATHALYAVFRTLDDIADEVAAGGQEREAARAELGRWREWLRDPGAHRRDEAILPAFRDTIERYRIPTRYFLDLIDGLEMDLDDTRYPTFADLALYCFRVASTVGLAMCHVLDANDPDALGYAAELGVAMQLTNILRDVKEDLLNGRVYLPSDMLGAAGWDEERLAAGLIDDGLREMLRDLIARARVYYARGLRGLPYLSSDARFAILVAARCYAGILDQIEGMELDVFRARAHVSGTGKAAILARTAVRRGIGRGALPPLPAGAPDGIRLLDHVAPRPPRGPLIEPA